ncbi:protein RRP5 homolog [Pieris brassicae]|uniref:protein RRP5 homolog n=1 Tax=Pieris brassicae TaxID=7116 RepID=UPI001E661111|nr:protein RRP5 homolog [Pieris brassicae]
MADVEEYFPRGGKKPTTTNFVQTSNFLGATEKKERKRKQKKKSEEDDGYLSEEASKDVDKSYKTCGVWLSYKALKQDFVVLGRISQIKETTMMVSLPSRLIGTVMACHISEPYNKLLEAYVDDKIDKVKELTEIFKRGQYVCVKVLEVKGNHAMLTMMPQHINSDRKHSDLHKGSLIQAAISSVEDHGYIMETGIPHTTAFLPKKNAKSDIELDVGMVTWCSVKSIQASSDNNVITLSSEPTALQNAFQKSATTSIPPGTSVEFIVDKPLDNGIEGRIFGDRTAYIQRHHIDAIKGKKPALGAKIRVRQLYTLSVTNIPYLTMRDIFDPVCVDMTQEQKYNDGDIVEEAQVLKILGRCVYFKLSAGQTGVLSIRSLQMDENLTDEELLAKSYPTGSTHKVRILGYHLVDRMYSVTDQPDILREQYFTLAQLSVGEYVSATITTVADTYLRATVGRIPGFVPQIHITDSGVFIDPKKASNSKLPKKKFKVGQEVKARVLYVDHAKNNAVLTLKPTLLSPDSSVLLNFEDTLIGTSYTGVITTIRDYLLVTFFNNITCLIPRKFVSREPLDNLMDSFHLGQLVTCVVVHINKENKKIIASLTTEPFDPVIKKGKRKHNNEINGGDHESNDSKSKKRKRSNEPVQENEDTVEENSKKAKKKQKKNKNDIDIAADSSAVESEMVVEDTVKSKKKDKKKNKDKANETDEIGAVEVEAVIENIGKTKKKDKKKMKEVNKESYTEPELVDKRKTKNDRKELKEEESDQIESDMADDQYSVIHPKDLSLLDLSTCEVSEHFKERIKQLLKSVNIKVKKSDFIVNKIQKLEKKGLNPKNKKYHTELHIERLTIQEHVTRLLETVKIAQEKLKELQIKEKVTEDEPVKVENKIENERIDKLKEVKVLNKLEPVIEVPSAKDFWAMDKQEINPKPEESSSSEDEEEEKPRKKRKKLTAAEKVAKAREEEEKVREMEKRAIEGENEPRSVEQFQRALLASPDCSQLWIAYMAFHLQATEIERARGVARKAINTINFREEQERLNVWIALLNLEHRFGTKESQTKTLEEALQMNDRYQVHSKLLEILLDTSKQQELIQICDLMQKKYRQNINMYIVCGSVCYKAGLLEKARQLMQKGMAALEKKEHVSLLVQFAQLERAWGERERAEALFEQVLAVYPARVDVCCAYVDMLLKTGDVTRIRQVLERMTAHKLPARKMKVLFKKWIEVEEKYGDKDQAEEIRQKALEYVEKAKF